MNSPPAPARNIADVELYVDEGLKGKFFSGQSLPVTHSLKIKLDGAQEDTSKTFTVAFFPKREGQLKPLKVKYLASAVRQMIGETARVKGFRWAGGDLFVLRFGTASQGAHQAQSNAAPQHPPSGRADSGALSEDVRDAEQVHHDTQIVPLLALLHGSLLPQTHVTTLLHCSSYPHSAATRWPVSSTSVHVRPVQSAWCNAASVDAVVIMLFL
jgi:hypothetical protein